jgi:hypothetical protein
LNAKHQARFYVAPEILGEVLDLPRGTDIVHARFDSIRQAVMLVVQLPQLPPGAHPGDELLLIYSRDAAGRLTARVEVPS